MYGQGRKDKRTECNWSSVSLMRNFWISIHQWENVIHNFFIPFKPWISELLSVGTAFLNESWCSSNSEHVFFYLDLSSAFSFKLEIIFRINNFKEKKVILLYTHTEIFQVLKDHNAIISFFQYSLWNYEDNNSLTPETVPFEGPGSP